MEVRRAHPLKPDFYKIYITKYKKNSHNDIDFYSININFDRYPVLQAFYQYKSVGAYAFKQGFLLTMI